MKRRGGDIIRIILNLFDSIVLRLSRRLSWLHCCDKCGIKCVSILAMVLSAHICFGDFCKVKDSRLITPSESDTMLKIFRTVEVDGELVKEPTSYIQVQVLTAIKTLGVRVNAIVHYFTEDKILIDSVRPFPVLRESKVPSSCPIYFEANKPSALFFPVTKRVDTYAVWTAIIVIGDTNEVTVATYPKEKVRWKEYDFPERPVALNPRRIERSPDVNPLVEYVFETKIKSHPQITFFLRKPKRAVSFEKSKGVLALCLLSHNVEGIKKRLQEAEAADDLTDVLRFAEENCLTLLCWGSQRFWNPRMNWDDLNRRESKPIETVSDEMADAWEKAVKRMTSRYKIPTEKYLLSGFSGAAQYALRLAMKKPQYFKAVHVHVPSSFPKPMPGAKNMLICLTTGEWEAGYDRSIRFLEEAQSIGIPIIYKAIPQLGHAVHPQAVRLGLACFEFAMKNLSNNKLETPQYMGDVYRHAVFPYVENPIGSGIWINLPSRSIAEAWL